MAMSTPSDPSVPPVGGPPATGTGAADRPGSYGESTYAESYATPEAGQSGGNGGDAGGGAKQKAQETASAAKDEGMAVASTATDQAKSVAETAKGQARSVTVEAKSQAQRVIGDAHGELRSQLEQRVGQVSEKARGTGDQLRALAEGRVDEAGPAADWARQASEHVAQYADRLNDMGLEGATQEVRRFARQRPMVFLGAAAAAGFLIGRTLKNASSEGQSSSTDQSGYGTRPVAGIDPYSTSPALDLTDATIGGPGAGVGSTLGTEVAPLGGGGVSGGVRPNEELR
jgi:hypothetical protein